MIKNSLYYGDCLQVMQDYIAPNTIDLIYLDPPFNSNRNYNAIYKDSTGMVLPEQIEAFCDIWELNEDRERAILKIPIIMRQAGLDDSLAHLWQLWMNGLRRTQPRLLAYLSYMTERLIIMKSLLKPTGTIYLHCDPTASHYIKVLMDAIFGYQHYINEIIWLRAAGRSKGSQFKDRSFGQDTDAIFRYGNGQNYTHNPQYQGFKDEELIKKFPHIDKDGRRFNTIVPIFCQPSMGDRPNLCYEYNGVKNPYPSGWRVSREKLAQMDKQGLIIWREGKRPLRKSYMNDYHGKPISSLWTDIANATGKEHLGYPTQKPLALLRRIILASSNEGDVVLDPFCGCATTIAAAHELNRRWIGIDIAYHAIQRVVQSRLLDKFNLQEGKDYQINGVPLTKEAAIDLWVRDKFQFQRWAVEQVDGFVSAKKSNDGGIDGNIYFRHENELHTMIISVKGGENIGIKDVRDLRGAMERSGAKMAGLIIRNPLTDAMRRNFDQEMLSAGFFGDFRAIQLLSLDEIIDGKKFHTPFAEGKIAKGQSNLI